MASKIPQIRHTNQPAKKYNKSNWSCVLMGLS